MKILITGINGFVGSHLAEHCIENKNPVFGTVRNRSKLDNLEKIEHDLVLKECELTDFSNVYGLINHIRPTHIFHLAAQSYVPTSWLSPGETLINNIVSQLNLFEAVRKIKDYNPRILIAGSSEEYGDCGGRKITHKEPITEMDYLNPLSPYAVSKVTQDKLACQYTMSYGMKIVVMRAFNHTGPRRDSRFVCATFAKQIAEIEDGGIIKTGNLDAVRDFTDVRDIVRAYYLGIQKCDFGTPYNICTGKGIRIEDVLMMLAEISGKTIGFEKDPERMRPSDLPILIGDNNKFIKQTDWEPEISFKTTLKDIYAYFNRS